jgi:hypothetical protein
MSPFENRTTGNKAGVARLTVIGLAIAGAVLAVWSVAVVALIIAPAVLLAALAVRAVRLLRARSAGPAHRPLVIDGEYEVLNSGAGAKSR